MKIRYTYKYPYTSWKWLRADVMRNKRIWWYNRERAIRFVEREQRLGYTSEPYMQLIEIDDKEMRVVAQKIWELWR